MSCLPWKLSTEIRTSSRLFFSKRAMRFDSEDSAGSFIGLPLCFAGFRLVSVCRFVGWWLAGSLLAKKLSEVIQDQCRVPCRPQRPFLGRSQRQAEFSLQ